MGVMRRSWPVAATWFLGAVALVGCGGDGDGGPGGGGGTSIADQPLTGKIGGQAFTVSAGETDAFLSQGDQYFVNLYGAIFTACTVGGPPLGANSVIFEIPKMPGTYNLGLGQLATLYDGATAYNRIASRGTIVIDSIAGTTITGGAAITFDANNTVNGKFTATICPE